MFSHGEPGLIGRGSPLLFDYPELRAVRASFRLVQPCETARRAYAPLQ